jgi:AcrR family transcriptional regulator
MGFDRASLRQIAEDAGITRNAIVNYYSSKMELYGASLSSVHEVVLGQILDEARQQAGPVHRRVMAVFERAVQTRADDETLVRFFVTSTTDALYYPSLREQVVLPLVSVRNYLQAMLDGAQADGELDAGIDTEATAQVCADLLWGLAFDISLSFDEPRTRRTLAALGQVVAAALSPLSQRIT